MLRNIRNFSKTLFAKILLIIIIIPFVFWGMGGVFNSGNKNNIVKINNYTISTQDFVNYLNNSQSNTETIKKNIDKNILEKLLSELISKTLIDLEIDDLNISISEKTLAEKIKKNENFLENGKFSRIKYEKFLLTQNLTAPAFEYNLKNNELKKKLFYYVSGGIKSPFFFTNIVYKEQAGRLELNFINLNNKYKKEESFQIMELNSFVKENADQLKEDYIDFSYIKITPQDLNGTEEFNDLFFKKIDEIENKISNGENFESLANKLKITPVVKKNYLNLTKNNKIEEEIYSKRNENKIQLLDKNDFYILYQIDKINKILPNIEDKIFNNKIRKILFKKNKYEYTQNLLTKINKKEFDQNDFRKFDETNIEKITLDSIRDNNKFDTNSVKLLYTLPINSLTLISDKNNNVYLANIIKFDLNDISKNSENYLYYNNQANMKIKDNIYSSYDYFLNSKYNVKINQKTLERVKNYFR